MNPTRTLIRRPALVSIVFYVGCAVLVLAMWLLTNYINLRPYVASPVGDPAAALSKAQDAYAAVNNLLTTLATGLLAGLGLFLTNRPEERYTTQSIWPAAASALCVCVSLFWGFISSQNVEWAIENQIDTLDLLKLQLPRQLQTFSMLLGVFFFADFVRRDLTKID